MSAKQVHEAWNRNTSSEIAAELGQAGFGVESDANVGRALHLVLVYPEIPWNTGNIGRTALSVGAELHLICPLGFSLEDRQVRRAGLDYWPRVRLRVWPDWPTFERALPDLGEPYLLSAGAPRSYWEPRYPDRTVLVLGRESVGLSPELLARFPERTIRLPMADLQLRSLNLSTAAALASYEVIRQWSGARPPGEKRDEKQT